MYQIFTFPILQKNLNCSIKYANRLLSDFFKNSTNINSFQPFNIFLQGRSLEFQFFSTNNNVPIFKISTTIVNSKKDKTSILTTISDDIIKSVLLLSYISSLRLNNVIFFSSKNSISVKVLLYKEEDLHLYMNHIYVLY